jgi:hypothetical protein
MSDEGVAKYAWDQPCCVACWYLHHPARTPNSVRDSFGPETCVFCGRTAAAGIYVRIDPALAPFPSMLKET